MQSDDRLANLFRRGVDPAFDELVERYRVSLVAFAGAIVGSARAEDVVQDSLVKAHRAMGSQEVGDPRAWLYRIVRNTALNEIRDGNRHEYSELAGTEADSMTPERAVEGREELKALFTALAELPEAQRQAIVERELGGYTHEQIARELEISTGATKQLIFRARKGLRNAFGALIPAPLIAWLASEMTGAFASASSAGAMAGGVAGAGSAGGATAGAGAGGIFAGLAGGGAAKIAAVAVVASGTVAAGVAVEERVVSDGSNSGTAIERTAGDSSGGIVLTEDGTPVLLPEGETGNAGSGTDWFEEDRLDALGEAEQGVTGPGEDGAAAGLDESGSGSGPGLSPDGRPGTAGRPGRPSGTPGPSGGKPGGGRPSTSPGNSGGSGGGRPATNQGNSGGSGAGAGNSGSGGRPSNNPGKSGGPGGGGPSRAPSAPGAGKPTGAAPSRLGS